MPKIIIEYSEDEQETAKMALNSRAFMATMDEFKDWLRGWYKHGVSSNQTTIDGVVAEIYEKFCEHYHQAAHD